MEMNFISPPNCPMTQTFVAATTPTMYKDTLFMDFSDDGHLLVGSSDVTASYWQGSIQVFSKFEDCTLGKNEAYYNGPIMFDGKFLTNNKLIISESEYKLKILSTADDNKVEQPAATVDCIEHFEAINQIALWKNSEKVLTASENHITIWDTSSVLKLCEDLTDYHTGNITSIDTKPNDGNMFVSVGADRRICIWDTRTDGLAMELYRNEFSNLTSVAWSPIDQNVIVVGTQSGSLYMLDVKQHNSYLNIQHCYKRSILKLLFAPDSEQLAVVGNTNKLQVYNCKGNEFSLCYNDSDKHKKYVCDVKWHNGSVFACGLGSHVVKHSF